MKSPIVKRSIVVAGRKTSVSLEDAFWNGLRDNAGGQDATVSDLVTIIDADLPRHLGLLAWSPQCARLCCVLKDSQLVMGNLPLDHAAQFQDATLGIGHHGHGIARSPRRQFLDRLAQAGDGAVCGTGFDCGWHV